jgi:hypothetical protein
MMYAPFCVGNAVVSKKEDPAHNVPGEMGKK